MVDTEQVFNEAGITDDNEKLQLHAANTEWRPTLEGSDVRSAFREKIVSNKIPRGAASKRGAAEDAPQTGAASSSSQPPLKSPRQ